MALTKSQSRALAKLRRRGGWASSYELKETLGTLNALHNKGFADRRGGLGAMAFPRVSITFKAK
jgi:hypothetical protein